MKGPQDLRAAVLAASLELIEQEGLEALSMREVARRAGVSHQAPYHHFGDREGILVALAEEGFRRMTAEMAKALAKVEEPQERLLAAGTTYVLFALRNPAFFKVMFRSELAPIERHDAAQEQAQTCFGLLVSTVAEVARAQGRENDPSMLIAAWSMAHGLATLVLEGKLDKRFGKGWRPTPANVAAVMREFGGLWKE
jgi:AcrR family transcriptional regulator